jgi:hypothetical protein
MNEQELTNAVRQSVAGEHMNLPAEQIVSRSRAIRAGRQRRVAAGVTAIATAGAASIAAAIVLPHQPSTPTMQDTAYVVSRVTQALEAMPADTVTYRSTEAPNGNVIDSWFSSSGSRIEFLTRTGQPTSDNATTFTRTSSTSIHVNYQNKTWSRSVGTGYIAPIAHFTCAQASAVENFGNPSMMAAWLRTQVSCGDLNADGTATINGASTIKLSFTGVKNGASATYYVNPQTYLPARLTVVNGPGKPAIQEDFQWLAPTAANLAKLDLPALPQGFARVSG